MVPARYHITIDVYNVENKYLDDEQGLDKFLRELPGIIGMKVLKEPVIVKGIPENPGVTGFVIIDFSHISCHTFTKFHKANVDIFSCKEYSQDVAVQAVVDFFHTTKENAKIKEVGWGPED